MSQIAGQLSLTELDDGPPAEVNGAAARGDVGRTGHPPTARAGGRIAARDRDAFLEAGAGTGKTTVLVDRYCAAVAEDGVEVDRILAFTFTERAAAEMRTRVRRELTARARATREAGDSARADELLKDARATERAWVMTIHAFCRRLLAAHPLAAGLDPRFRVLDAAEASRLQSRAADAALDELLATDDERVAPRRRRLSAVADHRDGAGRPRAAAQPGNERAATSARRRAGALAREARGGAGADR